MACGFPGRSCPQDSHQEAFTIDTSPASNVSTFRLILIPAVLTLAVTILRLVGELLQWSKALFNPEPGGMGAIVGIVWLVPIFGIYFALKLSGAGQGPAGAGKAIGYTLLGVLVAAVGVIVALSPAHPSIVRSVLGNVVMAASPLLLWCVWPALFKTLLAYAFAARIPVAIVMFFAIRGSWGTHYDALPAGFPLDLAFWPKYLRIALVPQLIFWVVFTILIAALFGTVVNAVVRRAKPASQAAS